MIELSTEESSELLERDDIAVHDSVNALFAYTSRYDETPIDVLVRTYYLESLRIGS